MSHILLTYHVDILDLLTVTNYIRQNLTASFMYSGAAIWNSLSLHVKNATLVNTFNCLYLKWKRLNDHCIISNIRRVATCTQSSQLRTHCHSSEIYDGTICNKILTQCTGRSTASLKQPHYIG